MHGSLKAVPLAETTPVGEAEIQISKSGIFRNYNPVIKPGKVTVLPAVLKIKADDAEGVYGFEPEYNYTIGDSNGEFGLAPWDREEEIIKSVGLERSKEYTDYIPGIYEDAITVKVRNSQNYTFEQNGESTVEEGTLTVSKGYVLINGEIKSKRYDGNRVSAEITVIPVTSREISPEELISCNNAKVTYYEIMEDSSREKLRFAPKDAGKYEARITVEEDACYNSAEDMVTFTIRKARPDVEKPVVPDIEMKKGLTLSDQTLPDGWNWINPERELEPGYMNAYAVYTPEDERNYFREIRTIGFTVYEKKADPDDGSGDGGAADSSGGSDNGGSTPTGDSSRLMLWICIMTAALIAAVAVMLTSRKKS